jgi:hypothetical protein
MAPYLSDEPDEERWLLKALRETAHELESQIWGLDEEDLRRRPSEDSMCLKEIAAHLRDCERYFLRTLELITLESEPRIQSFDGDALLYERDYRESDVFDSLEELSYLRQRAVSLLWQEDWDRTGMHPYLGPVSVRQLARAQSEHDLEHLWQARRLREGAGAPLRR